MEPRMVCWRPSSHISFSGGEGGSISTASVTGWMAHLTSFSGGEGGLSLQLLSQDEGAQLFRLCQHQQWLCGSVTCPRSGRLGQPQSKVVEDGGEKRRISQQGGALGEGGEGTSAQARRIAPEGPIFFKKIWEEIDCQNAILAFVSSLLF